METWWPEILRVLETNLSNAKTEGTNRIIKDVGRRACGFRNPTNHRPSRTVDLHTAITPSVSEIQACARLTS